MITACVLYMYSILYIRVLERELGLLGQDKLPILNKVIRGTGLQFGSHEVWFSVQGLVFPVSRICSP